LLRLARGRATLAACDHEREARRRATGARRVEQHEMKRYHAAPMRAEPTGRIAADPAPAYNAVVIAIVDVDYRDREAVAACLEVDAWTDPAPRREHLARVAPVAPYRPGAFYRRELPCLLAVLDQVREAPEVIVIDGYVVLDRAGRRPGLGAHLFEALDRGPAIVGVAKNRFEGAAAREVVRGASARPLYVTAVGLPVAEAAARVAAMHGDHRLPTLLRRVDRLARDAA
jgi:deoxyribonuclease V